MTIKVQQVIWQDESSLFWWEYTYQSVIDDWKGCLLFLLILCGLLIHAWIPSLYQLMLNRMEQLQTSWDPLHLPSNWRRLHVDGKICAWLFMTQGFWMETTRSLISRKCSQHAAAIQVSSACSKPRLSLRFFFCHTGKKKDNWFPSFVKNCFRKWPLCCSYGVLSASSSFWSSSSMARHPTRTTYSQGSTVRWAWILHLAR